MCCGLLYMVSNSYSVWRGGSSVFSGTVCSVFWFCVLWFSGAVFSGAEFYVVLWTCVDHMSSPSESMLFASSFYVLPQPITSSMLKSQPIKSSLPLLSTNQGLVPVLSLTLVAYVSSVSNHLYTSQNLNKLDPGHKTRTTKIEGAKSRT